MTVLPGTPGQQDVVVEDHEVPVGHGHPHGPWFERGTVHGLRHREGADPVEDPRQRAPCPGRQVEHDEDGGRQIGGQFSEELEQCFDSAGRGPDHHEIAPRHSDSPPRHRRSG